MKKILPMLAILGAHAAIPALASAAGLCCQLGSGVQQSFLGVGAPAAGGLSLQLTYGYTLMDKLRAGSSKKTLDEVANETDYTSIPTEMKMNRYTLSAAYGLSPALSAFVSVPWVRNTMDMVTVTDMGPLGNDFMGMTMEPVEGLGDVTIMGLYRLFQGPDAVSLGLGLKTPTGSSTEKTASGKFVHAHMQPGTGSWDPIVSLIYARKLAALNLQADLTYQLSTRNQDGYKTGDTVIADLSANYQAASFMGLSAGLTYFHQEQANDRDGKYTTITSLMDVTENTGGDSLWLSPGIRLSPLANSAIDLKVQLPLWEDVNGVQLVSSYRILAGLFYTF